MNNSGSVSIVNRCWRCRLFAIHWTDGWDLTDLQKELIGIIHGGHSA